MSLLLNNRVLSIAFDLIADAIIMRIIVKIRLMRFMVTIFQLQNYEKSIISHGRFVVKMADVTNVNENIINMYALQPVYYHHESWAKVAIILFV